MKKKLKCLDEETRKLVKAALEIGAFNEDDIDYIIARSMSYIQVNQYYYHMLFFQEVHYGKNFRIHFQIF